LRDGMVKVIIIKIKGCSSCPRKSRQYRDKRDYGELWVVHCCTSFRPPKSLEIPIIETLDDNFIPDWCPLEDMKE